MRGGLSAPAQNYNLFLFSVHHRLEARHERHSTTQCPQPPRPRHAAGAVRARLALPGPGRPVPRRQAARASRRSAASWSSGQDTKGDAQRPRRLLPAHGRRPDPGRRSRATRSPARSTTGAGAATASARRSRTPGGSRCGRAPRSTRPRSQRPAADLARRRGRAGRPRHPAAGARRTRTEDEYTDWIWNVARRSRRPHCRELIDNVVDMAHFYYVHFAFPTSFRNVFEGHMATQFMESKGRPDKAGRGTATRTCSSSPRRPTTDRRT